MGSTGEGSYIMSIHHIYDVLPDYESFEEWLKAVDDAQLAEVTQHITGLIKRKEDEIKRRELVYTPMRRESKEFSEMLAPIVITILKMAKLGRQNDNHRTMAHSPLNTDCIYINNPKNKIEHTTTFEAQGLVNYINAYYRGNRKIHRQCLKFIHGTAMKFMVHDYQECIMPDCDTQTYKFMYIYNKDVEKLRNMGVEGELHSQQYVPMCGIDAKEMDMKVYHRYRWNGAKK